MKALGYSGSTIVWHYAKFTMAITLIGVTTGAFAGNWMGHGLTRFYATFFSFPFLVFKPSADLYVIASGIAAALVGALRAIWQVASLAPAVAMQPPAPIRYRSLLGSGSGALRWVSQLTIMALRHLIRWPVRTLMTMAGSALAVADIGGRAS